MNGDPPTEANGTAGIYTNASDPALIAAMRSVTSTLVDKATGRNVPAVHRVVVDVVNKRWYPLLDFAYVVAGEGMLSGASWSSAGNWVYRPYTGDQGNVYETIIGWENNGRQIRLPGPGHVPVSESIV